MRRKLVALAAFAIVLGAPGAASAAVTADCRLLNFANATITGGQGVFTGFAAGYAMADTPGASISMWCEVRINGASVGSTPPGPAGQASASVGQVTYVWQPTDVVELCAVWTGTESGDVCWATILIQTLPDEVEAIVCDIAPALCTLTCRTAGLLCVRVDPR